MRSLYLWLGRHMGWLPRSHVLVGGRLTIRLEGLVWADLANNEVDLAYKSGHRRALNFLSADGAPDEDAARTCFTGIAEALGAA